MNDLFYPFDSYINSIIQSLPAGLNETMRILSLIGEPGTTVGIMVAIAAYGIWRKNTDYLVGSSIAIIAFCVNTIIKLLVHRTRPTQYLLTDHFVSTYSFPSGHAAGSSLAFGLIAYIIWRKVKNIYLRVVIILILLALIIGIGVSRVYLGYHYPSDVVAGWILGGVTIFIISRLAKFL